jgi:hypothetical protein
MKDKIEGTQESFFNHVLLIVAGCLMTLLCATIVANFGFLAAISIISYLLTLIVYFVIYLLWKE